MNNEANNNDLGVAIYNAIKLYILTSFSILAQYLNRIFGYLIDWLRVGELLRSDTHRYSFREMIPRLFVMICTVAPIVIYRTINMLVVLQIFSCFTVSHLIVILPLIIKRYKMRIECYNLIKLMKDNYCSCIDVTYVYIECDICKNIVSVMNENAPDHRSSAIWGSRKRKLTDLLERQKKIYTIEEK